MRPPTSSTPRERAVFAQRVRALRFDAPGARALFVVEERGKLRQA
jgi:hypothetical protein